MKHRVVSILMLALVLVLLLAVPAAADNGNVPFEFQWTDVQPLTCEYAYETGHIWHWKCTYAARVVSDNPALDQGWMEIELKTGSASFQNPHPVVIGDDTWGAMSAKWYIAVDDQSGWEGTFHAGPWGDPEQFPRSLVGYYNGLGYGALAGQHIWSEVFSPPQIPAEDWEWAGEMN